MNLPALRAARYPARHVHKNRMGLLLGIVAVSVSSGASATDTLDCEAPPYYLRVAVSGEYGAQEFSLHKENAVLAEGNIKQWRSL